MQDRKLDRHRKDYYKEYNKTKRKEQEAKIEKETGAKRSHHANNEVRLSMFDKGHFVCWDGEGINCPDDEPIIEYNPDGTVHAVSRPQRYALLMNNEMSPDQYIVNPEGISTMQCLDALMTASTDKDAIHVCYGASYDINMWLRDLPEEDLRKLNDKKLNKQARSSQVAYGKYRLIYFPRKSLEVREEYEDPKMRWKHNKAEDRMVHVYKKSITLWDVMGFFQGSFVDTLKKNFLYHKNPALREKYAALIEEIKAGKDSRNEFTIETLPYEIEYCKKEVDALKDLMILLRDNIRACGLKVTRYDGAGAIASAMLEKHKVKPHVDINKVPEAVVQASEYAFFGGRIETIRYGNYNGPVYHADINSAYPTELRDMPSLIDGTWIHETENISIDRDVKVSLFLVSWRATNEPIKIGPFPWRDRRGSVFFPPVGKTWIWLPELLACIDTMPYIELHIHESWKFTPKNDIKPFAFIEEMYAMRQEMVKNKDGAEKVIKLGLNSLYGKMVQSIGYNEATGRKPPYHNLVIGGLITSGVRARLIRTAMQCPDDIIMLATDGIYSTAPLDVIGKDSKEKRLGEWEYQVHDSITIVASGVYWYDSDKDETSYSRGFNKFTLIRDKIIESWLKGGQALMCKSSRFVTVGSAIGLNNFAYHCTWREVDRKLDLQMVGVLKRTNLPNQVNPANGLVTTIASTHPRIRAFMQFPIKPFPNWLGMESEKYVYRWDQDTEVIDGIPMREFLEDVAFTLA